MMAIDESQTKGARLAASCAVIDMGVRTIQRWRKDRDAEDTRMGPKTTPANKLCKRERSLVLATINQPEFRDLPPSQIVPRPADIGHYVASESTMYRVLKEQNQSVHRGRKKPAKRNAKPREKVATAPGQLYSWDITYLRSPIHGACFYFYMMLDVWSRKIVGHAVHQSESSELVAFFVDETYRREGSSKAPILHQDIGSPMKGATLLATLQERQIQPSYSRPHLSDDNPNSESTFGTMKTRPADPTNPLSPSKMRGRGSVPCRR